MTRVAIVTDAWLPQTNGVVTTLTRTGECLRQLGHEVLFLTPESFRTVPLPTYPSIRLALFPGRRVKTILNDFKPDAVHIATEGPLGFAARRYCLNKKLQFTTAYHTRFPEYLRLRAPIPITWSYRLLRWFHARAERVMVPTESQRQVLMRWGFQNVVIWTRGVDTALFRPRGKDFLNAPRPISLFAGRVAVEKNIEAFLQLTIPGTKYVVGDGPDMDKLTAKYPQVRFVGFKYGEELASYLAAANVFVFPSRTDTFGLVMLEAMACGVPVAAYPVTGPIDVVRQGETGVLDENLHSAVVRALAMDGRPARRYAEQHSWLAATEQFAGHLAVNECEDELLVAKQMPS
jgi:glycosyltransferase involved in cell wall biosynthesis